MSSEFEVLEVQRDESLLQQELPSRWYSTMPVPGVPPSGLSQFSVSSESSPFFHAAQQQVAGSYGKGKLDGYSSIESDATAAVQNREELKLSAQILAVLRNVHSTYKTVQQSRTMSNCQDRVKVDRAAWTLVAALILTICVPASMVSPQMFRTENAYNDQASFVFVAALAVCASSCIFCIWNATCIFIKVNALEAEESDYFISSLVTARSNYFGVGHIVLGVTIWANIALVAIGVLFTISIYLFYGPWHFFLVTPVMLLTVIGTQINEWHIRRLSDATKLHFKGEKAMKDRSNRSNRSNRVKISPAASAGDPSGRGGHELRQQHSTVYNIAPLQQYSSGQSNEEYSDTNITARITTFDMPDEIVKVEAYPAYTAQAATEVVIGNRGLRKLERTKTGEFADSIAILSSMRRNQISPAVDFYDD